MPRRKKRSNFKRGKHQNGEKVDKNDKSEKSEKSEKTTENIQTFEGVQYRFSRIPFGSFTSPYTDSNEECNCGNENPNLPENTCHGCGRDVQMIHYVDDRIEFSKKPF